MQLAEQVHSAPPDISRQTIDSEITHRSVQAEGEGWR